MDNTMREEVTYHQYRPPGVRSVLNFGSSSFIGEIDEETILKYPLENGGDLSSLQHEYQLLQLVGPHERIIAIAEQGLTDVGLYLERAPNGTLRDFLQKSNSTPSISQRLTWCRELVEAVAHVHSRGVIHCDINPSNILLDGQFHVKLADFQGCSFNSDGEILLHARAAEPCRYFCPRNDDIEGTQATDLFALGSTIHFIATGEEVFPDIIDGAPHWYEDVQSRFARAAFPYTPGPCTAITQKCWMQQYMSAKDVLDDIKTIEQLNVGGIEAGKRPIEGPSYSHMCALF
ncbi:hypothetical protein Purlil1_14103 [Purpureocillium lilacinum]|uniref:Protein kinase domain-containing protein n=1 Tax=Purpureocillium lilacinum TaxID=33203 RepID=A0ABR0BC82_PURLI|nr:hypothetical protein Purlil1_14103 [Purpureocillium lilacinum]